MHIAAPLKKVAVAARLSGAASACPYCRGEKLAGWLDGVRDRLEHVGGEWRFLRCSDCGSAVLDPIPEQAAMGQLYPPTYCFTLGAPSDPLPTRLRKELEYRLFFAPQYEGQVQQVMRLLLPGATKPRLLDVGCGGGLRLVAFRKRGLEVQGTDLDEQSVRCVRELGIQADQCAATEIKARFGPAAFDVITAYYVVEHLHDVTAFFRQGFEVLAPGGVLVAAVPLADSVQARLLGARWPSFTEAPRHLSLPSVSGLSRALAEAGFTSNELHADSSLMCAAQYGMALFPNGCTTHAEAGRWRPLLARLAGAVVSAAALPLVAVERALGKPGLVLAVGRKEK